MSQPYDVPPLFGECVEGIRPVDWGQYIHDYVWEEDEEC